MTAHSAGDSIRALGRGGGDCRYLPEGMNCEHPSVILKGMPNIRSRLAGRHAWVMVSAVFVALGGGCATKGPTVSEYLDPHSGVTVRSMSAPFVYARELDNANGDGRDFASVGAVEINEMGNRTYYLAAVSWSRVDQKSARSPRAEGADRLLLMTGNRPLELTSAMHDPRHLEIGVPPFRPVWGYYLGETWFEVTPDELREFAASLPRSIKWMQEGELRAYGAFENADAALKDFIRGIPAEFSAGATATR